MSDLNPHGVKVQIGGEEHELLFSVYVIDEIQSNVGKPLFDVMDEVSRASKAIYDIKDLAALKSFREVLAILLNADGAEITEKEMAKKILWTDIAPLSHAMLEAFGISLPEPDEDEEEDPDEEDRPKAETEA